MTAYTAEDIAPVCHEANRRLQVANGEPSPSLPWEEEPGEVRAFAVAAVEFAMLGGTPEDQFRQWRQAKVADGWTYGPVKDPAAKVHPCLVGEYSDLPEAQRRKDAVFAAIVLAMSEAGAAREVADPDDPREVRARANTRRRVEQTGLESAAADGRDGEPGMRP